MAEQRPPSTRREPADDAYQQRLGEVLRARDVHLLRAFLEESATRYGDARQVAEVREKSDAELEYLLHQMIVTRLDLAELHPDSRKWLFQRGHDSFGQGGKRRN